MEEMTLHAPRGQRASKLSDSLPLSCLGTRYTAFPTIIAVAFASPSASAMQLPIVARRTTVQPPLFPPLKHGIEYVGRGRWAVSRFSVSSGVALLWRLNRLDRKWHLSAPLPSLHFPVCVLGLAVMPSCTHWVVSCAQRRLNLSLVRRQINVVSALAHAR